MGSKGRIRDREALFHMPVKAKSSLTAFKEQGTLCEVSRYCLLLKAILFLSQLMVTSGSALITCVRSVLVLPSDSCFHSENFRILFSFFFFRIVQKFRNMCNGERKQISVEKRLYENRLIFSCERSEVLMKHLEFNS